jgi:hypothetical protein
VKSKKGQAVPTLDYTDRAAARVLFFRIAQRQLETRVLVE